MTAASSETPYLDSVSWDMHGHRKKVLFFIESLHRYGRERGVGPGGLRVLELGCGNGRNVAFPIAEQGFEVTGVDFHEPSIAWARAQNGLPNLRFVCSDVLGFRGHEAWDVVVLSDVLEHVQDPTGLLRLAVCHLRSDGMVLISIPNGLGPYEVEQFLIRIGVLKPLLSLTRATVELVVRVKRRVRGQPWPVPPDPNRAAYNDECGHVQFFRLGAFRRYLDASGLRIEAWCNGCWFGGDLTYFLFYFIPGLAVVSQRVADCLPAHLVSSWYFACRSLPERRSMCGGEGWRADVAA